MVRLVQEEKDSVFSLSADIASAHRLVKIRKRDWPLLACKARTEDKTVWINCVGTFGISSASYWWTRLFAGIGRLVSYVMQQLRWYQLVYVDDLHITCLGRRKFENLWTVLLLYELLGTPFSYAKFSGGLAVQFVGYLLDYRLCLIGITKRRGEWLVGFIQDLQRSGGTVALRRFNEFVGRLGFVARVLVWLKPFMAPLYAWSSVLDRSTVATAPRLVMLALRFLEVQLVGCEYMHTCLRPQGSTGEQSGRMPSVRRVRLCWQDTAFVISVGLRWKFFQSKRHFSSSPMVTPSGHLRQPSFWRYWWQCSCLVILTDRVGQTPPP